MGEGMKRVEELEERDRPFARMLRFIEERVVKGRREKYRITEA